MASTTNPYATSDGNPKMGVEFKWLTWEREHAVNPYVNKDGASLPGKIEEAFIWPHKEDEKRLAMLPDDLRKIALKSKRHMTDKMES